MMLTSATSATAAAALVGLSWLASAQAQITPNRVFNPPDPSTATIQQYNNLTDGVNPHYSTLLGNALWFYEAQRSGVLPSNNRVSWRNSSSINDGSLNGTDLSGGYYDAGDYIKATFPLCWTLTSMAWSAMSFGSAYARSGQDAYFDQTLRWGLDFLAKAHSDKDTLWVLVGDPTIDDQYWGGDQNIPTPRPAFSITRTNPGADAFGQCSAAFAAASYLYGNASGSLPISKDGKNVGGVPSMRNATYAASLLQHAEELWDLATTSTPMQVYSVAVPQAASSYPSSDYTDELILAGMFLGLATNDKSYVDSAVSFYMNNTPSYPVADVNFDWDRKAPALPIIASQIAQHNDSFGLNKTKFLVDSEVWLDRLVNGKMKGVSRTDHGLLWWSPESEYVSLNPALNAAFLADTYAGFATTTAKAASYSALAKTQVDYLLGSNPFNGPLIVGQHPNSPQNPHSALASGGNDVNNINTSPPVEAHVLYGAVVGGPDKQDRFFDIRNDWPQTEIALDYNAPLVAAAVSRIARNATSDPVFVTLTGGANPAQGTPTDAAYPAKKKTLSNGAIIGIAVSVIVVVFAAAAGLSWWQRDRIRWFYRHKKMGL